MAYAIPLAALFCIVGDSIVHLLAVVSLNVVWAGWNMEVDNSNCRIHAWHMSRFAKHWRRGTWCSSSVSSHVPPSTLVKCFWFLASAPQVFSLHLPRVYVVDGDDNDDVIAAGMAIAMSMPVSKGCPWRCNQIAHFRRNGANISLVPMLAVVEECHGTTLDSTILRFSWNSMLRWSLRYR